MLYVDQTQLYHLSLTCLCFILKYVKKEKSNHLLIQRVIVSTFLDGEHWCATLQLCNCATLQLCSFATVQLSDHLVQSQLCNCETIQCIFNCAFVHSEKNLHSKSETNPVMRTLTKATHYTMHIFQCNRCDLHSEMV